MITFKKVFGEFKVQVNEFLVFMTNYQAKMFTGKWSPKLGQSLSDHCVYTAHWLHGKG